METTDPGIIFLYFFGLVVTILLSTFLRFCFYRDDPKYSSEKQKLIPRGVYFIVLLFSFMPILNDVLAGVAIIATIILLIDGTLVRECKFTKWLCN
jgi:hypothetical protein